MVAFSDTHGRHGSMLLPDGDLLICAGDFTVDGRLEDVSGFLYWLKEQAVRYRHGAILIAGNHECAADPRHRWFDARVRDLLMALRGPVRYLEDDSATVAGYNIYGMPWTPKFNQWAFMEGAGAAMKPRCDDMPRHTDILVTPRPPRGILDAGLGCDDLRRSLPNLTKLRLHIFGHVHSGSGVSVTDQATHVNAAVLDDAYRLVRGPRVLDLPDIQ